MKAPQRLYAGVLRALTAALVPHGGDPGGLLNAQKMKNPLREPLNKSVSTRPRDDL